MFHPKGPTFRELAVQALSSTQRGYDLLAPKFDYTPFRTPAIILNAVRRHLEPMGPFENGLDLCCGTGAGIEILAPLCRRIVGLDFSEGMLKVGRRNLATAPGPTRIEWVRGDALRPPFAPVFDIVTCFGACGHIENREQSDFIDGLRSVLRPGGRFVFVSSYRPPLSSLRYWVARSFNLAMRVRNALVSPPFIMYYLTFLLPGIQTALEQHGFQTSVSPLDGDARLAAFRLIVAQRRIGTE